MPSCTTRPDTPHPTSQPARLARTLAACLTLLAATAGLTGAQCLVGNYDTSGAGGVAVVGSITYIADAGNNSGRRLAIFDTSNPESPVLLGSWFANGGFVNDVAVVDNTAFVACRGSYTDGLSIVDVSDPTAPVKIGGYNLSGNSPAGAITVVNDIAYIAAGLYGDLQIIDVSNPQAPALLSVYDTYWAIDVTVVGNIAYVADRGGGLKIIDVSDPTSPVLLGSIWTLNAAYGVTVVGNIAYVATDLNGGLVTIDISDPTSPLLLGFYRTPHYAVDVVVEGSLAYVADSLTGLLAIDVSDPTSLSLEYRYDTPGRTGAVVLAGSLAYVADGNNGLQIINVTTCPCPVDFNNDGIVNTQDFLAFLTAWANSDPTADWNADGTINTQDFLAYLADWAAGC